MAIALLTLLGLLLRLHGLHQSFWYDEARTVILLRYRFSHMWSSVPTQEASPPLYYVVGWEWVRIFGSGTVSMRLFSVIPGVATVPLVGLAARRLLHDRRAGIIAAALAACSPELIWYSQEVRPYSLLVAFSAASLLAFAYVREQPTRKAVAAWALTSMAALATHYYAGFLVVPEAAVLVYLHRRSRTLWVGIVLIAACQGALTRNLLSESSKLSYRYITKFPLNVRLGQILPQFLIGQGAPAWDLFKFVAFALVLAALLLLGFRATSTDRRRAYLLIGLAGAGICFALLTVLIGDDTLITRNLLELWIPAAIFLAACLSIDGARRLGAVIAIALCAIGIYVTLAVVADTQLHRPDWQRLADAIGVSPPAAASGTAQRLILIQRNPGRRPLKLYLQDTRRLGTKLPQSVLEIDIVAVSSDQPATQPTCWWGAGCNLVPSTLQSSYAIPHFHAAGVTHVAQFSILRLKADGDRPSEVTYAELRDAMTGSRPGAALFQCALHSPSGTGPCPK